MVYVGAVAILAVFAIMMTHSPRIAFPKASHWLERHLVSAAVFAVLAWAIIRCSRIAHCSREPAAAPVQQIGDALMQRFVLPLGVIGLLLTAALIGAVVIAMEEKPQHEMTPLASYLLVSALLFSIGLAGALTRRNAILVLIGIELMLNAANLNFIAFWRYGPHPEALTGIIFAIFSIASPQPKPPSAWPSFSPPIGTPKPQTHESLKGWTRLKGITSLNHKQWLPGSFTISG